MNKRHNRNRKGANLVEAAAALTFGLPLLILIVFVALECTRFFTIKSAMEVGSRNAGRALVVDYNKTKNKGTRVTWLTMPHYIANEQQFVVQWDNAAATPTFVTVTCSYPGDGSYGLQKFPAGPLRYLSDGATFNFGTTTIRGTFTVPVQ